MGIPGPLWLVSVGTLLTGCSVLIDTDVPEPDQGVVGSADAGGNGAPDTGADLSCALDADCERFGANQRCYYGQCGDAVWGCLGRIPVASGGTGNPLWRERYVDITTQRPPPGMTVKLCQNSDIDCVNPWVTDLEPDANGVLATFVPSGFEGYAVVSSTVVETSYIHFPTPIVEDTDETDVLTLQLLRKGTIQAFGAALSLVVDPNRAVVIAVSRDCTGGAAAGTVVDTSSQDQLTVTLYIDNDLPDPRLTETTSSGNTILINHPPGPANLTITRSDTGAVTGRRQLYLQPGVINYIALAPTP